MNITYIVNNLTGLYLQKKTRNDIEQQIIQFEFDLIFSKDENKI